MTNIYEKLAEAIRAVVDENDMDARKCDADVWSAHTGQGDCWDIECTDPTDAVLALKQKLAEKGTT